MAEAVLVALTTIYDTRRLRSFPAEDKIFLCCKQIFHTIDKYFNRRSTNTAIYDIRKSVAFIKIKIYMYETALKKTKFYCVVGS